MIKKRVKCKRKVDIERERWEGRKRAFLPNCNRDRWKVWQCVFEKRRRSGNVTFSAFRLQDDGDNFAFFSNPVDSRGKVTTNATNNVVFVCSSNRCFFFLSQFHFCVIVELYHAREAAGLALTEKNALWTIRDTLKILKENFFSFLSIILNTNKYKYTKFPKFISFILND